MNKTSKPILVALVIFIVTTVVSCGLLVCTINGIGPFASTNNATSEQESVWLTSYIDKYKSDHSSDTVDCDIVGRGAYIYNGNATLDILDESSKMYSIYYTDTTSTYDASKDAIMNVVLDLDSSISKETFSSAYDALQEDGKVSINDYVLLQKVSDSEGVCVKIIYEKAI